MLRYCAECDVNIRGYIACGSFFLPDELKAKIHYENGRKLYNL